MAVTLGNDKPCLEEMEDTFGSIPVRGDDVIAGPTVSAFAFDRRILMWIVVCLLASGSVFAKTKKGYGYKRGKDPLVLSVKRIVLESRRNRWSVASAEARKLTWQFKEFRKDLRLEFEGDFRAAVAAKSMPRLSRQISQLVYFAIVQKFTWNEKEKLGVFGRAKVRSDAALYYYQEILSVGVRKFDRLHKTDHHKRILKSFASLQKSLGSPGIFGLRARPPDLSSFQASRGQIEALLKKVYPHVLKVKAIKTSEER